MQRRTSERKQEVRKQARRKTSEPEITAGLTTKRAQSANRHRPLHTTAPDRSQRLTKRFPLLSLRLIAPPPEEPLGGEPAVLDWGIDKRELESESDSDMLIPCL